MARRENLEDSIDDVVVSARPAGVDVVEGAVNEQAEADSRVPRSVRLR